MSGCTTPAATAGAAAAAGPSTRPHSSVIRPGTQQPLVAWSSFARNPSGSWRLARPTAQIFGAPPPTATASASAVALAAGSNAAFAPAVQRPEGGLGLRPGLTSSRRRAAAPPARGARTLARFFREGDAVQPTQGDAPAAEARAEAAAAAAAGVAAGAGGADPRHANGGTDDAEQGTGRGLEAGAAAASVGGPAAPPPPPQGPQSNVVAFVTSTRSHHPVVHANGRAHDAGDDGDSRQQLPRRSHPKQPHPHPPPHQEQLYREAELQAVTVHTDLLVGDLAAEATVPYGAAGGLDGSGGSTAAAVEDAGEAAGRPSGGAGPHGGLTIEDVDPESGGYTTSMSAVDPAYDDVGRAIRQEQAGHRRHHHVAPTRRVLAAEVRARKAATAEDLRDALLEAAPELQDVYGAFGGGGELVREVLQTGMASDDQLVALIEGSSLGLEGAVLTEEATAEVASPLEDPLTAPAADGGGGSGVDPLAALDAMAHKEALDRLEDYTAATAANIEDVLPRPPSLTTTTAPPSLTTTTAPPPPPPPAGAAAAAVAGSRHGGGRKPGHDTLSPSHLGRRFRRATGGGGSGGVPHVRLHHRRTAPPVVEMTAAHDAGPSAPAGSVSVHPPFYHMSPDVPDEDLEVRRVRHRHAQQQRRRQLARAPSSSPRLDLGTAAAAARVARSSGGGSQSGAEAEGGSFTRANCTVYGNSPDVLDEDLERDGRSSSDEDDAVEAVGGGGGGGGGGTGGGGSGAPPPPPTPTAAASAAPLAGGPPLPSAPTASAHFSGPQHRTPTAVTPSASGGGGAGAMDVQQAAAIPIAAPGTAPAGPSDTSLRPAATAANPSTGAAPPWIRRPSPRPSDSGDGRRLKSLGDVDRQFIDLDTVSGWDEQAHDLRRAMRGITPRLGRSASQLQSPSQPPGARGAHSSLQPQTIGIHGSSAGGVARGGGGGSVPDRGSGAGTCDGHTVRVLRVESVPSQTYGAARTAAVLAADGKLTLLARPTGPSPERVRAAIRLLRMAPGSRDFEDSAAAAAAAVADDDERAAAQAEATMAAAVAAAAAAGTPGMELEAQRRPSVTSVSLSPSASASATSMSPSVDERELVERQPGLVLGVTEIDPDEVPADPQFPLESLWGEHHDHHDPHDPHSTEPMMLDVEGHTLGMQANMWQEDYDEVMGQIVDAQRSGWSEDGVNGAAAGWESDVY